ncbi:MAG TPA: hypothetical protein GYA05_02590 [Acholeplasmataceae bacterium]|nr:hypothetical protein [Acholeplasmataceae bacterium]
MILIVSGLTFAYWTNFVKDAEKKDDQSVTIGTGKAVTTSVNVRASSGKTLVPEGRVDDCNEQDATDQVVLSYNVTWTAEGDQANGVLGKLSVVISNVAIGGRTDLANFVTATVASGNNSNITLNGEAVTVTIEVTLKEPENKDDYEAIAGKDITFDVTFSVAVA